MTMSNNLTSLRAMTDQLIQAVNQNIAVFMGTNVPNTTNDVSFDGNPYPKYNQYYQYHLKWEVLMSVVEKICQTTDSHGENFYFRTFGMINEEGLFMSRISGNGLFEAMTLKEAVWLSIADWCYTYNKIKPQNNVL